MGRNASRHTVALILTDTHFLLPFGVLLLGIALLCTLK
jgi:hypothetical protein